MWSHGSSPYSHPGHAKGGSVPLSAPPSYRRVDPLAARQYDAAANQQAFNAFVRRRKNVQLDSLVSGAAPQ